MINHEGLLRNGRGVVRIWLHADPAQEDVAQAPDEAIAGTKRKAVADQAPDHSHDSHERKTLHHGGEHVLLAHQSAIKQSEARACHHQHQRRTHKHPGIVSRTLGFGHGLFKLRNALIFELHWP